MTPKNSVRGLLKEATSQLWAEASGVEPLTIAPKEVTSQLWAEALGVEPLTIAPKEVTSQLWAEEKQRFHKSGLKSVEPFDALKHFDGVSSFSEKIPNNSCNSL